MTNEELAGVDELVERLRSNRPLPTLPHEAATALQSLAAQLAEARAENERLRERVEWMGRDKETLLTFARAIQTWRSDADSYDEECDHPQRDYCEDVELMEKAAGYALRRIAERAALKGGQQ